MGEVTIADVVLVVATVVTALDNGALVWVTGRTLRAQQETLEMIQRLNLFDARSKVFNEVDEIIDKAIGEPGNEQLLAREIEGISQRVRYLFGEEEGDALDEIADITRELIPYVRWGEMHAGYNNPNRREGDEAIMRKLQAAATSLLDALSAELYVGRPRWEPDMVDLVKNARRSSGD